MCRIVAKPQTILDPTCITDPSLLSDSALKRCLNKRMSASKVKAEMDELIKSKPVLVISKSYCPFCKKAKQVPHIKNRIRTKFVSIKLLEKHQVMFFYFLYFWDLFSLLLGEMIHGQLHWDEEIDRQNTYYSLNTNMYNTNNNNLECKITGTRQV